MFRAAYVVSRVITVAATGPEVEGRQTSSHKAVVNLAEDYFEAIFYAIALVNRLCFHAILAIWLRMTQ